MASNAKRAMGEERVTDPTGRDAKAPTEIPARGWKEIALRTWKESSMDNVSLVAAGVAFYGLLALVPLLGATVLTYGLVADPHAVVGHIDSLTKSLPEDAAKLIGEQLLNVVSTSGGKKGLGLLMALAIALWGARNAAGSLIIALNIAYEEEEKRSFLRVTGLSLAITAAAVLLGLVAVGAVGMLAALEKLFPGLGPVAVLLGKAVAYAVLAAVAAAAAATLYRYGPSRTEAEWKWITPGSAFFATGWVVLTLGFGFYVSQFGKYGATYGSLSGVIVLVTWLYLSSFVLLFGAEFNSEIEHQTARDTTVRSGEAPLGARGAWSADHVAEGTNDQSRNQESRELPRPRVEPHRQGHSAASENLPREHPYIAARVTNRAVAIAGLRKVGMMSAALSTVGLSLLRKRGKAAQGAALLATAAGLSLIGRRD